MWLCPSGRECQAPSIPTPLHKRGESRSPSSTPKHVPHPVPPGSSACRPNLFACLESKTQKWLQCDDPSLLSAVVPLQVAAGSVVQCPQATPGGPHLSCCLGSNHVLLSCCMRKESLLSPHLWRNIGTLGEKLQKHSCCLQVDNGDRNICTGKQFVWYLVLTASLPFY